MATTRDAANVIQTRISLIAEQRSDDALFRAEAVECRGAIRLVGLEDRAAHFGTVDAIGIVLSF